MGFNKDGSVRQRSSSRILPVSHTISSAQLGATRSRFYFWVRMKWVILRGWLWKNIVRKRGSKRLFQDHVHEGNTCHILILLKIMITTYPCIWQPSGQSVTTLESSSGHWTMLFILSFLYYAILPNQEFGTSEQKNYFNRNNGRHDFQIDIAISLIKFAIAIEWDGKSKRPGWMRQ